VKVKWYLNQESVLDMTGSLTLDYYLVMTGPPPRPDEKRLRPWVIDSVYLFDAHHLLDELIKGGVKVGLAASVRKDQWQKAKIYPQSSISAYPLSEEQEKLLKARDYWARIGHGAGVINFDDTRFAAHKIPSDKAYREVARR
jgi:hypothetical protein